jgi:hypothetical protein
MHPEKPFFKRFECSILRNCNTVCSILLYQNKTGELSLARATNSQLACTKPEAITSDPSGVPHFSVSEGKKLAFFPAISPFHLYVSVLASRHSDWPLLCPGPANDCHLPPFRPRMQITDQN